MIQLETPGMDDELPILRHHVMIVTESRPETRVRREVGVTSAVERLRETALTKES